MSGGKLVAIHQPNVLPWLGYFDKLVRADVFVVLDNVQLPKTGGTWTNRVKVLVNHKAAWATVPVVRAFHGTREIRDIRIDETSRWRHRLLQTLRTSYGRAPAFDAIFPLLERLIGSPTDVLLEFNLSALRAVCDLLGVDQQKLVLASSFTADGSQTSLLVSLVRAAGGDRYLSGGGSGGYQDDAAFEAAGIAVVPQNFSHPVYPQAGVEEFVPGLSVVDALMNCGAAGVRSLLGIGARR